MKSADLIVWLIIIIVLIFSMIGFLPSYFILSPILIIISKYPQIPFSIYINGMFVLIFFGQGFFSGYQTIGIVSLILFSTLIHADFKNILSIKSADVILILLFGVYLSISLYWSDSFNYGLFKVQGFWLGTFFPFLALKILCDKDLKILDNIEKLAIFWGITASLVLLITSKGPFISSRNTIEGVNSIWNARDIGVSFIILYYYVFIKPKNQIYQSVGLLFIIILGLGMLTNGSRGPLVALGIVVLLMETINLQSMKNTYFKVIKIIYISFLLFVTFVGLINANTSRLNVAYMFKDGNVLERFEFYTFFINNFPANPIFGSGIGGFSMLFKGRDIRLYPHNIVMEILIELGIIGFAILCLILYIFFKDIKKVLKNQNGVIWLSLFIFYFISAMFSGDLFGNAIFLVPGAAILKIKQSELNVHS